MLGTWPEVFPRAPLIDKKKEPELWEKMLGAVENGENLITLDIIDCESL